MMREVIFQYMSHAAIMKIKVSWYRARRGDTLVGFQTFESQTEIQAVKICESNA